MSGTHIAELRLQVWEWWQLFAGSVGIGLAGLQKWAGFVHSCHQSESYGLTQGEESQGTGLYDMSMSMVSLPAKGLEHVAVRAQPDFFTCFQQTEFKASL